MIDDKRMQHVAEQILTDSSLTQDLNDPEANTLIEWGVAAAKQLANLTDGQDDTQAEETLYAPLKALRKLMRKTNNLTAYAHQMPPEDFDADKNALLEAAEQLSVVEKVTTGTWPDFKNPLDFTQQELTGLDAGARLRRIMAGFRLKEEASDEQQ